MSAGLTDGFTVPAHPGEPNGLATFVVDTARIRYGVARRDQLVVRALYDGWFSITDAMG